MPIRRLKRTTIPTRPTTRRTMLRPGATRPVAGVVRPPRGVRPRTLERPSRRVGGVRRRVI